MIRRFIAVSALALLATTYASAGVLRFSYKHGVKPAAKAVKVVVVKTAKVVI